MLAQVKDMALPGIESDGREYTINFVGNRLVPMIAVVDPDTCMEYCHIRNKPKDRRGKAPVCQHYEYQLLSNAEVAKLVSWLEAKGQGRIAREIVLQFPVVDASRNRYLHQCEREWASTMVLHIPSLKLFLRENLDEINRGHGYKLPRAACKLVPIMDDAEDYLSIHTSAEWWLPHQDITNKDMFLRGFYLPDGVTASIKAQWAMILPMISETNASWLRKGKYIASADGVLAGCKPAPGKVSKRVKLFTSPVLFALIPNEYSVKVIGVDWVKDKLTKMAQDASVELTDDDGEIGQMLPDFHSTWKTEVSPFDMSGGIYVRRSFANALWVMDSEGQFRQLSDGDKFTRLVGRFCVKGLVHVVDDPEMDADIILGEDCIKFAANDTFYHQPHHKFVVSDVAADYDKVGMRKLSSQVATYFPHYTLPRIAQEIEKLNITEIVQGTAPVEDLVDVGAFEDVYGKIQVEHTFKMFQEGVPMLLETIYGSEQAPRYYDSLWIKIRRYIQKAIDFEVLGFSGKLMVAPENLCVSGVVNGVDVRDVPLKEFAISVPVDLYHKAIKKLRREWIDENGGLVAALSSFPFTGQHGMVKVPVFFHHPRERCMYIGSSLADLVERDTDGDPFVALLDEGFIRQCATPFLYARAVRDAVNRRIDSILKKGKEGKLSTTTVDSEPFWQPVPTYDFLPTECQRRAAGCMIDDNMGIADNAVRLLKYYYQKYMKRTAHDDTYEPEKIWQNYEMDVDLAVAFMALSQQAVAEKEGTDAVLTAR